MNASDTSEMNILRNIQGKIIINRVTKTEIEKMRNIQDIGQFKK